MITDLALRSGLPDAKSYCNHAGLSSIVDNFWTEPTFASKEAMYEKQQDFDADYAQPHLTEDSDEDEDTFTKGTAYNPAVDSLDFNKYFRRLEDIREDYLEKYISNVTYTICRLSGGIKDFNYNHAVAPTLRDLEDDSVTELADLELNMDKTEWSDSEIKKAISQLPYVLRRFLNLSCYTGIHVLSFVCSYMLASEKIKVARQSGSTKVLKRNNVISENVWACDLQGNATKRIEVSNKNVKAYDMFDWMEGTLNMYVPYKEDVTNFMHYAKVLNLDITEDMSKYGADFVRSLTVVSLTPNSQYNPSVYNALKSGTPVLGSSSNALAKTISRFRELCASNEIIQKTINDFSSVHKENNFKCAKQLHYGFMMMQGRYDETFNYEFYDGFLYCNGQLAIIGSGMISDSIFADGRVLLSELGYCVAVSDSLIMELMPVGIALDNMMIKVQHNTEDKIEKWWSVSL